jgi:hypothetical protein
MVAPNPDVLLPDCRATADIGGVIAVPRRVFLSQTSDLGKHTEPVWRNEKGPAFGRPGELVKLIAGVGFEPTTSGL